LLLIVLENINIWMKNHIEHIPTIKSLKESSKATISKSRQTITHSHACANTITLSFFWWRGGQISYSHVSTRICRTQPLPLSCPHITSLRIPRRHHSIFAQTITSRRVVSRHVAAKQAGHVWNAWSPCFLCSVRVSSREFPPH
jgi:hypothetical protein